MNFLRFRIFYFSLSLLFLVPGIFFLLRFGLRPSIDFVGGSLIEIRLSEPTELTSERLAPLLPEGYDLNTLQPSGEMKYQLKGSEISNDQKDLFIQSAQAELGPVEVLRFDTIGPTLSAELLKKTLSAVLLVSGLITLYVWYRFRDLKYGVCATLAMFHDSLILIGSFSILGYFLGAEVDVLFVTALLTTLSFSVHDTIVVYDRIRELTHKHPKHSYAVVLNAAITETLARSINNSLTIILMLFSLSLLGGETIRWFSIALLIGAITGTYSSTFTAVPMLSLWDEIEKRKKK